MSEPLNLEKDQATRRVLVGGGGCESDIVGGACRNTD